MIKEQKTHVSIAGKDIVFATGKIARQADGAVMLTCGETMVLSTVCSAPSPAEVDFLPLRVDYIEKFSSAGKTLGGFIKREGKPSERETLICRLIDRPIRPMFEDGFFDEVQIVSMVLSYDGVHATDPLAICSASAALAISSVPLIKPIGAVRVGMIGGEFVINPTVEEQKESSLDLMLAGTEDAILMIEGFCDFLTEEQIIEAIEDGHAAIKKICQCIAEWAAVVGKPKNRETLRVLPEELLSKTDALMKAPLATALRITAKAEREAALKVIHETVEKALLPEGQDPLFPATQVKQAIKKIESHYMRHMILKEKKRCDGRGCEDIRPIFIDMNPLPRTHGSAIFTRGETQAIAVCTLGPESMGQRYEDLDSEGARKFYLQYAFPPYSVGEVGRMGAPGRREVGHGKLAERALAATLPSQEDFGYTIRLESNITESNGSSSMASVCGGCLALMTAGVPIKRPIAGIAMGLILEKDSFAILSDILGIEDALGDMDFKVTGDAKGVTAFQMDIKIEGINHKIMSSALMQAKQGRLHILNKMLEACPTVASKLSDYAPKISTMAIKPSKIGIVIGPGGKQIRAIIEETGVQVDINDDGIVSFSSHDADAIERAKQIVHNLTAEVEVGKTYTGKVSGIKDFGMFVSIFSKEGLLHISEISHQRIENIRDHYKEGDIIDVKVLEINDRGQMRLSHKALTEAPPGTVPSESRPPREHRERRHNDRDHREPRGERRHERERERI